jgi:hypothetical protein
MLIFVSDLNIIKRMYETITILHSYWAYLVLLVLILAGINALIGYSSGKNFGNKDLRISLFGLILSHIQLLIGLVLYFVSDRFALWGELGMGGIMKNPDARLLLVEHPTTNIIAIALITIGWSKHKKQGTDKGKFGKIALFYLLGLILILSRIPYNLWFS